MIQRIAIISILLISILSTCLAAEYAGLPNKIDLRILYVGHRRSDREKDYVDFLSAYFSEVKTAELTSFNGKKTEGFDIVILDYDGGFQEAPRVKLPEEYARATVTVGVPGALICGRLRLKNGYL